MSHKLTIDLGDLEPERLEVPELPGEVSLESLLGGHALAETAASCSPTCSCCISCCCCS